MTGLLGIVLILTLLVGAFLLLVALEGKRVGTEPRCRTCTYNLTGLTNNNCPECGQEITRQSVMQGRRQRSQRVLLAGALLTLIPLGGLVTLLAGTLGDRNIYEYSPLGIVEFSARHHDTRALDELVRRYMNKLLPPAALPDLALTALECHAQVNGRTLRIGWADLLAMMSADGCLAPETEQRFFRQLAPMQVVVRKRIRQGDPLIVKLEYQDHGSARIPLELKLVEQTFRIGTNSYPLWSSMWGFTSLTGDRDRTLDLPLALLSPEPGTYEIAYGATQVFRPARPGASWKAATTKNVVRVAQKVEILPADAEDPITLRNDDGIAGILQERIHWHVTRYTPEAWPFPNDHLAVYAYLDAPVRLDLAFDVLLLHAGGELHLGELSWAAGQQEYAEGVFAAIPKLSGQRVTLILRASRRAATLTTDCYDIWDGEFTFRNVRLRSD